MYCSTEVSVQLHQSGHNDNAEDTEQQTGFITSSHKCDYLLQIQKWVQYFQQKIPILIIPSKQIAEFEMQYLNHNHPFYILRQAFPKQNFVHKNFTKITKILSGYLLFRGSKIFEIF